MRKLGTRDYDLLSFADTEPGDFKVVAFSEWYEEENLEEHIPEVFIIQKKDSPLYRVAVQEEATIQVSAAESMADAIIEKRIADRKYWDRLEEIAVRLVKARFGTGPGPTRMPATVEGQLEELRDHVATRAGVTPSEKRALAAAGVKGAEAGAAWKKALGFRGPVCPDCGEVGECKGHMGCQYPGDG